MLTAPQSLTVEGISDTTVTLLWSSPDPPNGIITQYTVEYRRTVDTLFTIFNLSNTTLIYMVTGLAVDTEYQFRLTAAIVVGNGPFSEVVQQTCKL